MAFIQNHPIIKNDKMLTSSNTFSEFTPNNTHTCRELLSNKNKDIFPEFIHIKHYWHLEGVIPKQY